ncbi:MAG: hypothetical protein HUJ29_05580 [Gammaproteobacteria bacterium]|nr:hypothetical protein [Gammaproteobacteria bacterium]
MSETIARQWLEASARTATDKQFTEHMDLISKRVSVTGVEGFDSIDYDAWYRVSEKEFAEGILKSVRYDGLKMLDSSESQVRFKTFEVVEASDATINAHGIEVMLEREADGKWRLLEERVLTEDEARQDGLVQGTLLRSLLNP